MTNDEIRMTNDPMRNDLTDNSFVIGASSLIRYSDFVIPHSPESLAQNPTPYSAVCLAVPACNRRPGGRIICANRRNLRMSSFPFAESDSMNSRQLEKLGVPADCFADALRAIQDAASAGVLRR